MSGTNKPSDAVKSVIAEEEGYFGPIEFEYNGNQYKTVCSGDCPEMYDVVELLEQERVSVALRHLLDSDSYAAYKKSRPKPSDALGMLTAYGKAAGTDLGESGG